MHPLLSLRACDCVADERYEWSSRIQGYVKSYYVIFYTSVDNYLRHGAWMTLPQIEKHFGHSVH